jgi:ADP-ribose pyrophosphatase YjhB (NUDIX family)
VTRFIPRPLGHFAYRVASAGLRLYSLVVRPDTRGVKCLLCVGDEVLLVRHSYGAREWDLPGGFVRQDEDFEPAARRELHEELGIPEDQGTYRDLGHLERHFAGRHETIHMVRVDLPARTGEIQGFELCRIGWFSRHRLPPRSADLLAEILQRDTRFA